MELIRIKKVYTGRDGKAHTCYNYYLRHETGISCPVQAVCFNGDYTNQKLLFAMSTEAVKTENE